MKLGVMSDTHGNISLMQSVADKMVNDHKVKAIIHLGDNLADTKRLDTHGAKLLAVPGIYEDAWKDKNVQHRIIKEFEGIVFLISHTPSKHEVDRKGDINPSRARSKFGAHVLLHGHTHKPTAMESPDDGLIVINPGHLKDAEDRNAPASYAIIDVSKEHLDITFLGVDDDVIEHHNFKIRTIITDDDVHTADISSMDHDF